MALRLNRIWEDGWRSMQIIARETMLTILLILCLAAVSGLLHQKWVGIAKEHVHLIEKAHFWYSFALMVLLPVRSIWEIMGARDDET